jgi:hypothetical protein|tara:strand:+ start:285 stop:659 length:375 start_codon:yes stop_codon:yes gene_type:complete
MALNWYISEVEDWDNYCFEPAPENPKEERMTPLTNQLINMTMAVGMHEITKKNYREFYTRMLLLGLDKSLYTLDEDGNQVGIQLEDVKRHIGLGTNASSIRLDKLLKNIYLRKLETVERMENSG